MRRTPAIEKCKLPSERVANKYLNCAGQQIQRVDKQNGTEDKKIAFDNGMPVTKTLQVACH